jgi:hypothetical protein
MAISDARWPNTACTGLCNAGVPKNAMKTDPDILVRHQTQKNERVHNGAASI